VWDAVRSRQPPQLRPNSAKLGYKQLLKLSETPHRIGQRQICANVPGEREAGRTLAVGVGTIFQPLRRRPNAVGKRPRRPVVSPP
jgi:hypothetical protein